MNILHDENSGCKGNILSLIVLYAMFQKLFLFMLSCHYTTKLSLFNEIFLFFIPIF